MSIDPFALIVLGVAVLLVGAAVVSARRFVRKQEREGLWDENGPIHPTAPPGDWGLPPGYGAHRPEIEEEIDDSPDTHPDEPRLG